MQTDFYRVAITHDGKFSAAMQGEKMAARAWSMDGVLHVEVTEQQRPEDAFVRMVRELNDVAAPIPQITYRDDAPPIKWRGIGARIKRLFTGTGGPL